MEKTTHVSKEKLEFFESQLDELGMTLGELDRFHAYLRKWLVGLKIALGDDQG